MFDVHRGGFGLFVSLHKGEETSRTKNSTLTDQLKALATADVQGPSVEAFLEAAEKAVALLEHESATTQNLANTVWACARLETTAYVGIPAHVATFSLERLSEFETQHLANAAWAFARITLAPLDDGTAATATTSSQATAEHPLLLALGTETWARTKELDAQNLANIAWAFVVELDGDPFKGRTSLHGGWFSSSSVSTPHCNF